MGILQDGASGQRLPRLEAGIVALPPSKSQVLRALMVAAGSRRRVTIAFDQGEGWAEAGEDIHRGFECARALGCHVSVEGGRCVVEPTAGSVGGGVLSVGESGFLGRVAPTCAALSREGRWDVDAAGSLNGRSSPGLWGCLSEAGVALDEGDGWLQWVEGASELGELRLRNPESSQELSAILIGLACRGGGEVRVEGVVPSEPYLDLTRSVLSFFGASVESSGNVHRVLGAQSDPPGNLSAEVDASAAAVALGAGCIAGVRLEVPCPASDSSQGDWQIVEHLRAFGCEIESSSGRYIAAGKPTRGADLDLSGEPDLAPVLAAVAAAAAHGGGGESVLSGLDTLDGKESKRGAVLERGLTAAGFSCHWADPVLKVSGEVGEDAQVILDSAGDHRMAFAFALVGAFMPGVAVGGGGCIAKSWPNFWSAMG